MIKKNFIKILNSYKDSQDFNNYQNIKLKKNILSKDLKKSKYLSQLKTHSFSLNKIENFIYKARVIERQYDDVSIDIHLNNELVYRDDKISNPYLVEDNLLTLEVINLPKRDNEWKEQDYDKIIMEENSIELLQCKHFYINYIENIGIKKINDRNKLKLKIKNIKKNVYTKYFSLLNNIKINGRNKLKLKIKNIKKK